MKQTQTQPKEDFIKALHHTKVLFKSLDIDDEVYIYLQKVLKESEVPPSSAVLLLLLLDSALHLKLRRNLWIVTEGSMNASQMREAQM